MDTSFYLKFIILIILLLLSAFFSSAETALTTVNKIKIMNLAAEGDKRALTVQKVIERPKKMLSAILIGNNIVNLSASSLATTLAVQLLGSVGAGIATGILTLLILIFGEITPKSVATIKAVKLSLKYAPYIYYLMVIFTPFIIAINFLSSGFIKLFGVDPDFKDDTITEEEIRTMVDVSHENGEIEGDERVMIHKVFDFSDATAKEVMIPRIDMATIDSDGTKDDLMEIFRNNMYTRIPVYDRDADEIKGIINMKDVLLLPEGEDFEITKIMRDAYFTYEMKNISDLFDEMRKESIPIAIVLDEYGSTSGMITLEDLLEEIVGEIRDEYDEDEEDPIVKLSDREYKVIGSMNLDDLCDVLPLEFESEDYDTIGGYLTGEFDHFPNAGEIYVTKTGIIIKVDEVDDKRVTKVKIKLPPDLVEEVADISESI